MKTIGFIKEIDKKIVKENYWDINVLSSKSLITDVAERNEIIQYLNGAEMIFSVTLALFDGEKYIGPYMIFSDGEWIWPNYFSYNLTNQEYINSDFLSHVRQKNYNITSLTKEQKREATFFLEKEMLNI